MAYDHFNTGGWIISSTSANLTFNTTWGVPNQEKDNVMITKVSELAAGWVGTVFTRVDNEYVPVADTRACKSKDAAERKARKLALDIVKNGYSG